MREKAIENCFFSGFQDLATKKCLGRKLRKLKQEQDLNDEMS
jgi:hypothetical protein